MNFLNNKNVVIIGGSDGIGFSFADILAENGANVLLISRNEKMLRNAHQKLLLHGTQVLILSFDLSQTSEKKLLVNKILPIFPDVDILVNNAGVGRFINFEDMDEDLLDLHLDINIKATYLLTHYLFSVIKRTKENVLNISSYFSNRMLVGRATTAYSMSKGAIDWFTKSLAFEAGKWGIRVNAIAPGSVATGLLQSNYNHLSEEGRAQFDEMIKSVYPLQRIGEADDIAEMVLFLFSEQAKWFQEPSCKLMVG